MAILVIREKSFNCTWQSSSKTHAPSSSLKVNQAQSLSSLNTFINRLIENLIDQSINRLEHYLHSLKHSSAESASRSASSNTVTPLQRTPVSKQVYPFRENALENFFKERSKKSKMLNIGSLSRSLAGRVGTSPKFSRPSRV